MWSYGRDGSSQHPLNFGVYVTARIEGKSISATRVPDYLLRDGKVPVYEQQKLRYKKVSVSHRDGQWVYVDKCLADGDLLITSVIEFPLEGMDITLTNTQEHHLQKQAFQKQAPAQINNELHDSMFVGEK